MHVNISNSSRPPFDIELYLLKVNKISIPLAFIKCCRYLFILLA